MGFQPSQADIDAIETIVTAIQAKTDNLPTSPANQATSVLIQAATDNLPSDPADESSLEAAISTSEGNVTDEVKKGVSPMTFWSAVEDQVQLTQASGDFNLPDVVVSGLPSGISIVRVSATIKIRAIENTSASGANAINGAATIQVKKSTGTWGVDDVTAIDLTDDMWNVAASTRESGDVVIGDNDVKSKVDGNATYNLRFEDVATDYDYLQLNDIIVGLTFFFNTGS